MNTDNIGRGVALVAAVISALGGLALLLDDVVKGVAPFEVKHGITIGIVLLAILAGHSITNAWRAHSVFGVVGFLVVFLASTGLVVVKSTGRQAEHTFASQADADFNADERAKIRPKLVEAEEMLSNTMKKVDADCVNGRKSKGHCDGLRTTLGVYQAAVTGYQTKLEKLGPPKPVAPEAENFAELAATFGANKAKAKAATVLAIPFLTTALFEFGAIVGFYFAFRHRKSETPATVAKAEQPRQPLTPAEQSDFWTDDTDLARLLGIGGEPGTGNWGNSGNGGVKLAPKGGNGGGAQVFSKREARLDLTARLATGETIPSQDVLANGWGVDKSTVSKWLKDWRNADLIPAAQRVGRCHRLVADA